MNLNLNKSDFIDLNKVTGETLTSVTIGLGWDVRKGFFGGSIDLDASCVMFAGETITDTVWFRQLKSRDGSVKHTGDNVTGAGDGDDEQIIVNLDQLPSNVTKLVFTVNSYTGDNFNRVQNAYCRIVDNKRGNEIARFNISDAGPHTGMIMASLTRSDDIWTFTAIGKTGYGRTYHELLA